MILSWANDGGKFDEDKLNKLGFTIDSERDIKQSFLYDINTGEKINEKEVTYNFVGFMTNDENNIFISFPKKYQPIEIEQDSRYIFQCIATHMQRKPELYIGNINNKNFKSNYPFSAFFNIYNYYLKYGLYMEDRIFIKENVGGKVSWKDTISRANKCLIDGELIVYPIYYRKKYQFSNFITECMINAINYTLEKFQVFIGIEPIDFSMTHIDLIENKEYVLNVLNQIRQQTFKDNEIELIDFLIEFYLGINIGGNYYLKHYSFSSVWEDMVEFYLRKYYKEIDKNNAIIFDKSKSYNHNFYKETFHTNLAKTSQYISPDHYLAYGDTQLIFDAKYYNEIRGMNYKQISYVFMLKELRKSIGCIPEYSKTYSALILPSNVRDTKIHFKMDPLFNFSNKDIIITEEYLDIRDVIKSYISK